MSTSKISVVFFDLGDTLGRAVVSAPPAHLEAFNVFTFVPNLLKSLHSRKLRLGIISNTGEDHGEIVNEVLGKAGILDRFEKALCIYSADVGLTKDTPQIFKLAADRADLAAAPNRCLFVGENAAERHNARTAGMLVCADPQEIDSMLSEE